MPGKAWTSPEFLTIYTHTLSVSKVHGANMGPTWVLSAPGGPHVGPINIAIRGGLRWIPSLRCSHFFSARDPSLSTDTQPAVGEVTWMACSGSNAPDRHLRWPHTLPVQTAWPGIPTHAAGRVCSPSQMARFMGPTWGLTGAERTQVGPMLAPWTLLSGCLHQAESTGRYSLVIVGKLYHRRLCGLKLGLPPAGC